MGIILLLTITALSAMAETTHTSADVARRHANRPIVIAHRGASHIAPENTVAAISKAAELDAVAIEFDVHLSKDNVPVIIHDFGLARTTNGRGAIRDMSWSEIKTLDAGSWFDPSFAAESPPSLRDGLNAVGNRAVACVEIKTGQPIVSLVHQQLESAKMLDRAIIFSFKPKQVHAAKQEMPDVPALLLVEPGAGLVYLSEPILAKAFKSGADLIGLDHSAVTPPLVRTIQEAGYPVFVYTVDQPDDVQRMIDFGVDGIISNRPRATLSRIFQARPPSK